MDMRLENGKFKSPTKIIPIVKAESLIPAGPYCYSGLEQEIDESQWGLVTFNVTGPCPFWSKQNDKPEQMNGYCSYLKLGDWMGEQGTMLLWDQVKECGVREDD